MWGRPEEEGWQVNGRTPKPKVIDILWGSLFKVPVQHWHHAITSVLPRLDPSMAQWESNSQPKDNP